MIQGNFIVADPTGTVAVANGGNGIFFTDSTNNNTVGGTASGAANLISGNGRYGVRADGASDTGNVIENNYVGTQAGGSGTLLNGSGALGITGGAAVLVAGTFTGDVLNQGSLGTANGPAVISITGNYTENSSAVLNVQIAGPGSFDRLSVSGTATLAGTLNVSLLNGFLPDPSESFPVISAGTRSGTYATFNPPNYGGRAVRLPGVQRDRRHPPRDRNCR